VLSRLSVTIDAPAELVFRLARPVDRWAVLLPHYHRSRVVRTLGGGVEIVDFVARRPLIAGLGVGLPVAWRARTWSEAEGYRLRFRHVAGATREMDVTWRIEPADGGTRVTIEHEFRPSLPGFARLVDSLFTRPIAGQTLATFKALAESLAVVESGEPSPTNHLL
jgi:uncharacterized membrane protein